MPSFSPQPRLNAISYADAASAARVQQLATAAEHVDGYAPLNEQALFDLAAGTRRAWIATADIDSVALDTALVVLGSGELDLVVHPDHRRQGVATALLNVVLDDANGGGLNAVSTAWAHGDHPGARALADRYQFDAARTLLQLRLGLGDAPEAPPSEVGPTEAPGPAIEAFRPGRDDADWVELNALVFADHPEQGSMTLSDLADRQHEPWFEAGDFLVVRDALGRLVGYNWLKVEADLGEIYVIGVHPDAAGQGLGRTLMQAGLARLRERGCRTAALYVEADSLGPVHLYRSLGFTDFTIDVQYRRRGEHSTG
ncbi:mycothiol synthase [Cryobacterium melibiosiphilum]|uniref:Mycothiol acetyltransferase n=1 Tax=Cryobacterium melibiosiphilum TaxID=995039 RepID=A0A3A5MB27_9MICO|nr:mycothiol synthase [Cryobacterium melibiosiphilum]RJT86150.1 mycothiol synthase [Cryobacterium melibiosiphilum]